jgi:hypothetical protein
MSLQGSDGNPQPLLDNCETAPAYGPCNAREDDSPKRVEREYPNDDSAPARTFSTRRSLPVVEF